MAHSEIIFVQITLQMLKRIPLIEFSLNPLLETSENLAQCLCIIGK